MYVYARVDTCTWHMQRMRRWSVDKEEKDDPSFEMIPKVMNYKPKCQSPNMNFNYTR